MDLDQALLHATLEVRVDEAKRDAKVGGDTALGALAIVLHRA